MTECETPPLSNKINDDEQQLIRLCLKKPKTWNWELSTSKSSSNIAFPTIQLYDEDNETLLVETNEANFTAGSILRKSASVSKASSIHTKRKTVSKGNSNKSPITAAAADAVAVVEHEANTKRDLNLFDCDYDDTSKMEKKQLKIYSRTSSCRSRSSILKRIREFSELNHDSSDDDECSIDDVETLKAMSTTSEKASKENLKKKYSIRTCNVGTILVPKESFSKVSHRRRRRSSVPNGECCQLFCYF